MGNNSSEVLRHGRELPGELPAHRLPSSPRTRPRSRRITRIWIGGYQLFQQDMADYDALLTAQGIRHTTETPTAMAHAWDSGWVPLLPFQRCTPKAST